MYDPDPDRAHDPVQAAADALIELGHTPGDDPHAELKQLAGDLKARVWLTQAAVGDLTDPDNRPPLPAITAYLSAIGDVLTALMPLAETQLNDAEQAILAARFGLDTQDGQGGRP